MRIVLVNWAKIWHGATRGGGVNGYVQSLALALRDRGHEVVSLCSGTRQMPPRGAKPPPRPGPESGCHARRLPDWLGVRVYEVFNSPVNAPSIRQMEHPEPEIASPELDGVVEDLLGRIRPDLVHIHSLEGFTARLVPAARRAGARVVFSLHNYHPVCPQVYLMQGGETPCRDFEGGRACQRCAETLTAIRDAPGGGDGTAGGSGSDAGAKSAGKGGVNARGVRVKADEDVEGPRTLADEDRRGMTQRVLAEREATPSGTESAFTPIDNTIEPDPASAHGDNGYARRRAAMVEALNGCDRVLAVSSFVARTFASMGVDERALEVMPIGTRMVELAAGVPRVVAPPEPFAERPDRPIRLVFIGHHNRYKGLPLLLEALESLETRVLGRFHLSVHAQGAGDLEARLRRLEPRLARLTLTAGYEYQDIPHLVGGADLGVVPSTWWDNAPQTVFELLACGVPVLGAEVGGIPDFVRDGVNGLLFRAGDRDDLVRALREVAADPGRLDGLRAGVEPPRSIEAHIEALASLYARIVSGQADEPSGGGGPAPQAGAGSTTRAR